MEISDNNNIVTHVVFAKSPRNTCIFIIAKASFYKLFDDQEFVGYSSIIYCE